MESYVCGAGYWLVDNSSNLNAADINEHADSGFPGPRAIPLGEPRAHAGKKQVVQWQCVGSRRYPFLDMVVSNVAPVLLWHVRYADKAGILPRLRDASLRLLLCDQGQSKACTGRLDVG